MTKGSGEHVLTTGEKKFHQHTVTLRVRLVHSPFLHFSSSYKVDQNEPWQGCEIIQRDPIRLVPKHQLTLAERINEFVIALRTGIWTQDPLIPLLIFPSKKNVTPDPLGLFWIQFLDL